MIRHYIKSIAAWFTNYPHRRLEWMIAFYTVAFGAFLMLPVTSMRASSFRGALATMDEPRWGVIYFVVGLLHAMALHINGRSAWTPFARAGALFLNSQVFIAMAFGVSDANPYSTGVFTYSFFGVFFCGAALASAAHDCGKEVKIWRGRNGRL